MRSTLVMSLIGAASMAVALLVGCGDSDSKPVLSKAGQSCGRTADCADGLSCIANTCFANSTASGGSGGSGGTAAGPILGGEGESCTSRRDCADSLACFNQRCTASGMGEGGQTGTPPSAQLGAKGETCRVNADCDTGLVCVPSEAALTGVCDTASTGVTPTGMVCGGECGAASDCCQLPLAEAQAEDIHSCPDLTAEIKLEAIDCSATQTAGSNNARLCFLDATYCSGCTGTTWKCTDSQCVYQGACTVAAGTDSPKGCPADTRLGSGVPACNAKTLKCTGAEAVAGCTTDASCVDSPVADSVGGADVCSTGECTCYSGDHLCYRTCARDLDCPTGKVCDTKTTSLCVPDTQCTQDSECIVRSENLNEKCDLTTNTCKLACASDLDCETRVFEGQESPFSGLVCGADGFCTSVTTDCVDSSQCGTLNGYKTFCVPRPATDTTVPVSSAVTN